MTFTIVMKKVALIALLDRQTQLIPSKKNKAYVKFVPMSTNLLLLPAKYAGTTSVNRPYTFHMI